MRVSFRRNVGVPPESGASSIAHMRASVHAARGDTPAAVIAVEMALGCRKAAAAAGTRGYYARNIYMTTPDGARGQNYRSAV